MANCKWWAAANAPAAQHVHCSTNSFDAIRIKIQIYISKLIRDNELINRSVTRYSAGGISDEDVPLRSTKWSKVYLLLPVEHVTHSHIFSTLQL